jgi:hypothetical protein
MVGTRKRGKEATSVGLASSQARRPRRANPFVSVAASSIVIFSRSISKLEPKYPTTLFLSFLCFPSLPIAAVGELLTGAFSMNKNSVTIGQQTHILVSDYDERTVRQRHTMLISS